MNKKTVLITGASRGIGAAMAKAFAATGYNVAINYYNSQQEAEALEALICQNGQRAKSYKCNIADYVGTKLMVAQITKDFGQIDLLINNAGIAGQKLFQDITPQEFENMMAINVGGVFNACHAVTPQMLARKQGKIINISSIWGICGASMEVHYSASKAAVIGLTKALAAELGPSGITVNCIAPGAVATGMNSTLAPQALQAFAEETPLGRIGTAEEIAQTALFLASPAGDFYTGQVLSPNGGAVI